MEPSMNSVIIGAISGIAAASVTQIATWIIASQNYKREIKKDYQLHKINAYKKLFSIFSELTYDISTAKKRNLDIQSLYENYVSLLNEIIFTEGFWLDDKELLFIRNIIIDLGAGIIDEIERKRGLPLSRFDSNLIGNIVELTTTCREKAQELHFQHSNIKKIIKKIRNFKTKRG